VSYEAPGFVDHHTHLLRVSHPSVYARRHESITAFHRDVLERDSTPMDELEKPLEVTDQLRGDLERGLNEARRLGLVEITEAGMTDWAYLDALRDLRVRDELPVRVRILVASGIADLKRMARTGDPWVEVIGVKLYADGWVGPRTCAMCQPFDDEPGNDGVLFMDADTLARRADPFAEAGWTVATHAIGDRGIETVLDAYEKVWGRECRDAAPRIEHAQVLNAELVKRMAELGVVACIQPGFAVSDAESARRALGDRWEDAYRWDTLLDAGVRVIAGSDHPIESLSPLVGLQRLVTGDFEDGKRSGAPTLPFETAYALMTDADAGVTVLSDDPHSTDEDELSKLEIVETRPSAV
jgi:predicted amidohydrolase YtcJ